MDLQAFFMERVEKPSEEEVIVSGRFPAFRLRGISEEENGQIRAGCRRKDGSIDPERYLMRLTAACVAEPELSDAALQKSWGVLGEEALLAKMLTAGEFAKLSERAQAVCGFDVSVREMAEEIKKGSCRATKNSTTPTTPCMNAE